jgi:hypothetical protein
VVGSGGRASSARRLQMVQAPEAPPKEPKQEILSERTNIRNIAIIAHVSLNDRPLGGARARRG